MADHDRDALAQQVGELRRQEERLRFENASMREALVAQRAAPPPPGVGNLYERGADHLPPAEQAALRRHTLMPFPTWAMVALHFVTLGLFPLIFYSLQHDRLPRAEPDDPSAARAIGYSFIPFFNLYWLVFNPLRVTDRVNLQYRLRGFPAEEVPRGLVMASAIVNLIPYINLVAGYLIFWPATLILLQRAVNRLVAMDDPGPAGARARVGSTLATLATPQMRIAPSALPPSATSIPTHAPPFVEEGEAEVERMVRRR